MAPPTSIDPGGITPDLLRSTDSFALADVIQEANSQTQPIIDGAGFDNRS